MIELIDNLSQTAVTMFGTIAAGTLLYRTKKQAYFLLTCFYGTFTLGTLYWTIYLLLTGKTPQVFYVSDLAWVASFVFLLTLILSTRSDGEKRFRHPAAWLSPIVGFGMMLFFYRRGDYFFNTMWCTLTAAIGWFSVNGLIFAKKQMDKQQSRQWLHMVALLMVATEYCLWTASCFWLGDTLLNPYFWFDFLLSTSFLLLLPAVRKAVEQ